MIETTIALRYARALTQLAKEAGRVDEFGAELTEICALMQGSPELHAVLANRHLPLSARFNILDKIFATGKIDILVRNFVKILVRKGRVQLIGEIVKEYKKLADVILGREPMLVVSAVELPADIYDSLARHFSAKTGKQMVLKKKIDTSVLGGVCVQIGGMMYDATLAKQLVELKSSMLAA